VRGSVVGIQREGAFEFRFCRGELQIAGEGVAQTSVRFREGIVEFEGAARRGDRALDVRPGGIVAVIRQDAMAIG
jgi:hypothetical protein